MHHTIEVLQKHQINLCPFEEKYKQIHQNPELSRCEVETAALAAAHLRTLPEVIVHEKIGGHGVVGTLRNGEGPTVMLRADMDALPHLEKTGLPYASTKVAKDIEGKETPVMHACGHDMHTANLMAAASILSTSRADWKGTAIFLFQPAEEIAFGAKAMLNDGFYRVRVFGKSGRICRPDLAVDSVLTVAHIITRLQDIATREVRPEDFAVVGCTMVHGGSTFNLMPDYCEFSVSIRSFKPEIHARLVAAVKRTIQAECDAAGCPSAPEYTTLMQCPATVNDDAAVKRLRGIYGEYFGDEVIVEEPFGASEDFSFLASAVNAPYVFVMYGGHDGDEYDKAKEEGRLEKVPNNHSALFAPVLQPTMSTAIDAFVLAALEFLGKP